MHGSISLTRSRRKLPPTICFYATRRISGFSANLWLSSLKFSEWCVNLPLIVAAGELAILAGKAERSLPNKADAVWSQRIRSFTGSKWIRQRVIHSRLLRGSCEGETRNLVHIQASLWAFAERAGDPGENHVRQGAVEVLEEDGQALRRRQPRGADHQPGTLVQRHRLQSLIHRYYAPCCLRVRNISRLHAGPKKSRQIQRTLQTRSNCGFGSC